MMSFRYPEYLWGLLLLLVPILIHLLRFRKQQVKKFPGVFRLVALLKETQSKQNLKHYILLLNRLLLLIALVMAFAQPSCQKEKGINPHTNIGVLWDASPSMWEPGAKGEVPIETAKIATLKWLKSLPESASIFWLDRPYQSKTRFTKSEAIAKLNNYSQPSGYFPLSRLLSDNSVEKNTNWFVVTDEDIHAVQDFSKWMDSSSTYRFVDVKVDRAPNYSIDTAYCLDALEGRVKARISRTGNLEETSFFMQVSANNTFIGDVSVVFNKKEQSIWVEFIINEISNSDNRVKLSIPKDAYRYDNELYLSPVINGKARVFLKTEERPRDLERLLRTFDDRLILTDSIIEADLIIWLLEDNANSQDEDILNRVKAGIPCIIIPNLPNTRKIQDFLPGGDWKSYKEDSQGEILDYRGFAQEPFKSSLERYLDGKNVLPKVNQLYNFPYDKNLEWNRILITDSERDFLVKRTLGEGDLWLFLTDYTNGMKSIRESSWFVGILGPILLANKQFANSICAFWDEEWIKVPDSDLFKIQDPVILTNKGRQWGTSLGVDKGVLSFNGVKDDILNADWYHLVNKVEGDSICIGINAPRLEMRFSDVNNDLFEEGNIKRIKPSEWHVSGDFPKGILEDISFWKYIILSLLILELVLGVLVLRTNR